MKSDANQNSKADVKRRKGTAWTEQEHSSFLQGLDTYGKGDWRSISRHSVKTRTAKQVASHAQNHFKRLKTADRGITSVDAEAAGTSLVLNTEDMIGPACGGSQAVPNSINESMLPQESTNAEQMIAVAGGIDDLMTDQKDADETAFLIDTAGRSLSPSKQPCTAASSPISIIGSDLQALLAESLDEDYAISSIFDVGNASTSSYPTVFVPPSDPPSNTPVDYEALAYVDDLFIDQMFWFGGGEAVNIDINWSNQMAINIDTALGF